MQSLIEKVGYKNRRNDDTQSQQLCKDRKKRETEIGDTFKQTDRETEGEKYRKK